jgi:branched-subunit amino acid aminotransferase/4-amino-4-deoxychorismate lyase
LNYLDPDSIEDEARSRDFEAVVLNERGEIVSATRQTSSGQRVERYTPSLATGAIAGVTRECGDRNRESISFLWLKVFTNE